MDMTPQHPSINHFIEAVDGKPLWEVMHLANEEATKAERFLIKEKTMSNQKRAEINHFIKNLTEFVIYMRSAINTPGAIKIHNPLLSKYRSTAIGPDSGPTRRR